MVEEFNIVILGDKIVGKSTLTTKIIRNISISEYDRTIIRDSHVRHVLKISGKACSLVITDTTVSEDNRIAYDHHIATGDGFFIVFSVDSFESYKTAIALKERIERRRTGEKVPMLLFGNKTDLGTCEDLKGPLRAGLLANLYGVPYVGTSAKSGVGVTEAYITLIESMISHVNSRKEHADSAASSSRSRVSQFFRWRDCMLH